MISQSSKSSKSLRTSYSVNYSSLASRLRPRVQKPKETKDATTPESARTQSQATVPKKGSSSTLLSTTLRALLEKITGTKQKLKELDDIDSTSMVKLANKWENHVRRIAQDFEAAEEQRIVDLTAAIEQCTVQVAKREEENTTLHEILKLRGKEMKLDSEKRMAANKQGFKMVLYTQLKNKEDLLKKKYDEKMKHKFKKQKEKLEAYFAKKVANLRQYYEEKQSEQVAISSKTMPPGKMIKQMTATSQVVSCVASPTFAASSLHIFRDF